MSFPTGKKASKGVAGKMEKGTECKGGPCNLAAAKKPGFAPSTAKTGSSVGAYGTMTGTPSKL